MTNSISHLFQFIKQNMVVRDYLDINISISNYVLLIFYNKLFEKKTIISYFI